MPRRARKFLSVLLRADTVDALNPFLSGDLLLLLLLPLLLRAGAFFEAELFLAFLSGSTLSSSCSSRLFALGQLSLPLLSLFP
jgi:hypothetical protein